MLCVVLGHFPSSFSLTFSNFVSGQNFLQKCRVYQYRTSEDTASVCLFSPILPFSSWKFVDLAIHLIQVCKRAKFMPVSGPSPRLFSLLRSSPNCPLYIWLTPAPLPLLVSPQSKSGPLILPGGSRFLPLLPITTYITCSMFTYCQYPPFDSTGHRQGHLLAKTPVPSTGPGTYRHSRNAW